MNNTAKKSNQKATLMVQGATSDAGKSILVTALCRILRNNNFNVAPFKPQNMALNSAVTAQGGEIGRAQAVQAQACKLEPSTLMNPILLKPNSQTGSQVIVHGKSIGNMDAKVYHGYKPNLLNEVIDSHKQLNDLHDIVIVEGAGSPAEINLREHDLANMGFAEAIDCPVIIVADIHRGGVFAHLYGTYALLSDSEKSRIKGFVINQFRGDVSLLQSGLDWLTQKTSVPVLAVIPFIENLHIEAEDSMQLGNLNSNNNSKNNSKDALNVCVIALPKISNFTDFDALSVHPQINLSLCKTPEQCINADVIIVPGSKSVIADLTWLTSNGWDKKINQHLRYGGKVMGICGGLQMLGNQILDPKHIESEVAQKDGLNLLDIQTTLTDQKTLTQVNATCVLNDESFDVTGYEIHAGISEGKAFDQPFCLINSIKEGAISTDKQIIATYLHGIFDSKQFMPAFLKWADFSSNTNIESAVNFDYQAFKEQQIEYLSQEVEKVFDVHLIKQCLGINP
ncbi:cobyric acid synthase [Marinicellulosiphila megalodicopiae]|uniref:cobyric acid synthase n=1 Tax=Marinicellulosiphila megalodicopiae TaxID=2724896 RepID=UPI003BAFF0A4